MNLTWQLGLPPLPARYPLVDVLRRVSGLLDGVRVATGGLLQAEQAPPTAGVRHMVLCFGSVPSGVAYTHALAPDRARVTFSTAVRWDITRWQRWFASDESFDTLFLHELGHVIGLRHSNHLGSIMAPRPLQRSVLTAADIREWREHLA